MLGTLIAGVFLLGSPVPADAQAPRTMAVIVDGREQRIAVSAHRGFPAAAIEMLSGDVAALQRRGALVAGRLAGSELRLRVGSPFVLLGGAPLQLANVPYRADGRVWVPLELIELAGAVPRTGEESSPGSSIPVAPSGGTVAALPPGTIACGRPASIGGTGHRPCRVVIDAGHGGKDPGTRSPRTGIREKDIALSVALRVHDLLSDIPGIDPLLTRDDDTFIPLHERSSMAVEMGGDLFVSIHVNAQPRGSSARGFETYFLSEAKDEESRLVAVRENSVMELEDDESRPSSDVVQFILSSLDQNVNVLESRRVAGLIQNELRGELDSRDRGVRQAGFRVLVNATGSMPSILVELGFITNPEDERLLRSESGQERLAGAVAEAIEEYFREYGRRLATAGAWN